MTISNIEEAFVTKDEVRHQLEKYAFQINRMVDFAQALDVCSKWSAEEAVSFAGEAKSIFKKIEATRKDIIEPAKKFTNHVNDTAKIFTDLLRQVEDIIKMKVDKWKRKHEAEEAARLLEAQELAEVVQSEIVHYSAQTVSSLRAENVLAYEKTSWNCELKDISHVPREYLMLDEQKVKMAIKNGTREIPGLTIFQEQKTVIRTR